MGADDTVRQIVEHLRGEAEKAWAAYNSRVAYVSAWQSQYDLGLCRGLDRALKMVERHVQQEESSE